MVACFGFPLLLLVFSLVSKGKPKQHQTETNQNQSQGSWPALACSGLLLLSISSLFLIKSNKKAAPGSSWRLLAAPGLLWPALGYFFLSISLLTRKKRRNRPLWAALGFSFLSISLLTRKKQEIEYSWLLWPALACSGLYLSLYFFSFY